MLQHGVPPFLGPVVAPSSRYGTFTLIETGYRCVILVQLIALQSERNGGVDEHYVRAKELAKNLLQCVVGFPLRTPTRRLFFALLGPTCVRASNSTWPEQCAELHASAGARREKMGAKIL